MRLFIAEKPSLGKAIAQGLGGGQPRQGYIQCGNDKVTHCFGHMLELFDPEDYDAKYKQWNLDDLPIPSVFPPNLKPKAAAKEQLTVYIKFNQRGREHSACGRP